MQFSVIFHVTTEQKFLKIDDESRAKLFQYSKLCLSLLLDFIIASEAGLDK